MRFCPKVYVHDRVLRTTTKLPGADSHTPAIGGAGGRLV